MLPRFSFRIPQCERGLEALSNYHTIRETSTGVARDEPCHDWSSHACDALRLVGEAEAAGMLSRNGIAGGVIHRRAPVMVRTGFRGAGGDDARSSILDRFFSEGPQHNVRVMR